MAGIWTVEKKRKRNAMFAGDVHVLTCNTWSEYYNEVRKYTPELYKSSVEASIKLSCTPDPAFAAKIEKHRRTIRLGVSKFLSLTHWKYAVTGSKFDIGRLISGDPHSALKRVAHNTDRTVKILFCTENQSDTHAEAIVIRAAALAELMIALEEQGIKVELIMGYATYNEKGGKFYESRVKLKSANTPLNIGLLKYQLDGTAFLYTLESQLIRHKFKMTMGGNPGMQCDADLVLNDGYHGTQSDNFSSPEKAVEWTHRMFEALRAGTLFNTENPTI